jgi:hypothetical protein
LEELIKSRITIFTHPDDDLDDEGAEIVPPNLLHSDEEDEDDVPLTITQPATTLISNPKIEIPPSSSSE